METYCQVSLNDLKAYTEEVVRRTIEKCMSEWASKSEDKMVSRKEAASIIGCDPKTLDSWSASGIITRHKVGSKVFYRLSEVKQFIYSKTNK